MKKYFKKIMKMIFYTFLTIIISISLFVTFHPTFGATAKGDSLRKIQNSKYYKNGTFQNIEPTSMQIKSENNRSILKEFILRNKKGKIPNKPLPTRTINKTLYQKDSNKTLITWLGHSTILLKINNTTIITDPVFSKRASPIVFLGPKAFEYENQYNIEDLPKIDIVLISHDHYDHLDMKAIKKLKDKVTTFYVPLGVKAHLLKWGINENKIKELDWYEENEKDNIKFISIPTRHFSGRGIFNRQTTQWTSWIIQTEQENIYFGGDSGYSKTFKEVGDKYKEFDIVFLENGAYDKRWKNIHMLPNQTIQAAIDLNTKVLMPIHQFKFDLAFHNWTEPIENLLKENKNMTIATPKIGKTFTLNPKIPQEKWWRDEK